MKRRRLGKEARPQTEELWEGGPGKEARPQTCWTEKDARPKLCEAGPMRKRASGTAPKLLERNGWKCFGKEVQ